MAPRRRRKKAKSDKVVTKKRVWAQDGWTVVKGELKRGPGRPSKVSALFEFVGEKLPYGCLEDVRKELAASQVGLNGVYMAHDSMGTPRYIGRGAIFTRLKAHLKAHPRELAYFSFYVVKEKAHEREVETLLIRAAGDNLEFNDRKKRVGIKPGDIKDFEAGTRFCERQQKKGRKRARPAS